MSPVPYLGYVQAAQEQDPIKRLLGGAAGGQALIRQNLTNQGLSQEVEKERLRQEALQGYGQTGDLGQLMKADPEMGLKFTAAQMKIAGEASDYWDTTKAGLTKETYPAWREDTLRRFPTISPAQFPPAEQFKTDQDFEDWKYQKERMAARFKAMSGVNSMTPKVVQGANAVWDPVSRSFIQAPAKPESPLDAAKRSYYEQKPDIERSKIDASRGRQTQKTTSYGDFKNDYLQQNPNATTQEIIYEYNKSVEGGKAAGKATAPPKPLTPKQQADARVAESKAKLMQKLGGGESAPSKQEPSGGYTLKDTQGRDVPVDKETYDAYWKQYGGQK